jgi:DNA-binding transcriptional LysR family regulator
VRLIVPAKVCAIDRIGITTRRRERDERHRRRMLMAILCASPFVTGPGNPLARRRRIGVADLLKEPWTLQPHENNFGSFAMEAFRAAGVAPPQITIATTSSDLRGEMLATGRYLSMFLATGCCCRAGSRRSRYCRLIFPIRA